MRYFSAAAVNKRRNYFEFLGLLTGDCDPQFVKENLGDLCLAADRALSLVHYHRRICTKRKAPGFMGMSPDEVKEWQLVQAEICLCLGKFPSVEDVIISTDPSGAVVKVKLKGGFTNDGDGNGVVVPN